ncbi:MAG: hypothetical protein ABR985_19375 [Methanotrichaceae archaeon]
MLANCYFGRLNTGKMKIREVMARKGDTRNTSIKFSRRSSRSWPRQGA